MIEKEAIQSTGTTYDRGLWRRPGKERALASDSTTALSPEEAQRMILELEERRIELEIQNEELRRKVSALCKGEDKFRIIFETSNDGILITDPVTRKYIDVNATMCRMMGYTREEILKLGVHDLHPPADLPSVLAKFEHAMATNTGRFENMPMLRKDGSAFPADLSHTTVVLNGRPCAVGIFRDIVERKRMEDALHLSKARYQSIIEDQTELICRYMPDGRISFVNGAYARYYGKEAKDLLNQNYIPHIPEPDLSMVLDCVGGITSDAPIAVFEHRVIMPDGVERWQQWTHRGIYAKDGILIEYQAVGRDVTVYQRAEESLRRSESENRMLLNAIPDLLFLVDRKGMIRDYRCPDDSILFVPPNVFLGKNLNDVLPAPIAAQLFVLTRQVLASGSQVTFEYELDIRGKTGFFDDRIVKLGHDEVLHVIRDITERKKAEKEVQRLSGEQRAILDNIANGVFYLKNRKVQWANRNAAELFGYSLEEITGKETSLFYPDRESFEQLGREAYPLLAQGRPYAVERLMKKNGGELIWCGIVGQAVDVDNLEQGAIWLLDDITKRKQMEKELEFDQKQLEALVEDRTKDLEKNIAKLKTEVKERKRAEDTLRRNSALLRGVFEGIQDGIAVVDTNHNIIMTNRAVEGFFRNEKPIGFKTKKCFEVFRQSSTCCDDCAAVKAIEKKTTQVETLFFSKEGEGQGLLENDIFPLYDEDGVVRGVIHYLRDITEKRMLEERAQRNDHLAALGQISAGIAHEINNPNNIIMGNSELLKDVWHDADSVLSEYSAQRGEFNLGRLPYSEMRLKVDNMINRIFKGSERINAIVNGMKLYTSRMQHGYAEEVVINDVVSDCIEMLGEEIGKTTDVFSVDLGENIPPVTGNRHELEEVITNLLSNALQALTERTKKMSVTTRHDQKSHSLILVVKDEGAGMTSEVLRQAANPFFTTKQGKGGMGLGLSIAYSIIHNHQGSLDFESKPSQGTVATVRLPLSHD